MNDFAFVAIMIGFFVLAVLFVRACEHIIGPDEEAAPASTADRRRQKEAA